MKTELLFDTNVVIDYLNGHTDVRKYVDQCSKRLLSFISEIEILSGIPESHEVTVRRWLHQYFEIIVPDEKITKIAIQLRRMKKLKLPDTLILATAKVYAVKLCTRDAKDFDIYSNVLILTRSVP